MKPNCVIQPRSNLKSVHGWISLSISTNYCPVANCPVAKKQSRVVRKPVKANPALKVTKVLTFLLLKCFFLFVELAITPAQN